MVGAVSLLILQGLIAFIMGIANAATSGWFNSNLTSDDRLLIGTSLAQLAFATIAILGIHEVAKRRGSSFTRLAGGRATIMWIFLGILSGICLMGIGYFVFWSGTSATAFVRSLSISVAVWLPLKIASDAVLTGVFEELVFRGILFVWLRKRIGSPAATVASSAIFAVSHLEYLANPPAIAILFLFGIAAALLFEASKSLSPSIAFHISGSLTSIVFRDVGLLDQWLSGHF